METKYHINPETKRPNVCRVKLENCPVSTSTEDHYPDKETAQEALRDDKSNDSSAAVDEALRKANEAIGSGDTYPRTRSETISQELDSIVNSEDNAEDETPLIRNQKAAKKNTSKARNSISKFFSFVSKYSDKLAKKLSTD